MMGIYYKLNVINVSLRFPKTIFILYLSSIARLLFLFNLSSFPMLKNPRGLIAR